LACANKLLAEDNKALPETRAYLAAETRGSRQMPLGVWAVAQRQGAGSLILDENPAFTGQPRCSAWSSASSSPMAATMMCFEWTKQEGLSRQTKKARPVWRERSSIGMAFAALGLIVLGALCVGAWALALFALGALLVAPSIATLVWFFASLFLVVFFTSGVQHYVNS
jgi:hypothetical protein